MHCEAVARLALRHGQHAAGKGPGSRREGLGLLRSERISQQRARDLEDALVQEVLDQPPRLIEPRAPLGKVGVPGRCYRGGSRVPAPVGRKLLHHGACGHLLRQSAQIANRALIQRSRIALHHGFHDAGHALGNRFQREGGLDAGGSRRIAVAVRGLSVRCTQRQGARRALQLPQ